MSKSFSAEDVASHNKPTDLLIIVNEDVYDVTKFQEDHPGGKKILQRVAGKDASVQFAKYHGPNVLVKYAKLKVGSLNTKAGAASQETEAEQSKVEVEVVEPKDDDEPWPQYGDMVPYADPNWYQTYHSPFYNETHVALRSEMRKFVDQKITPFLDDWEEQREVPESLYKEMATRGYLAGIMGSDEFPTEYTPYRVASVPHEKWDLFHELVLTDELSRCGSGGLVWNLVGGFGIGCPPVYHFGSDELKKRILPGILAGDKRICLAITEPDGGSDVANLGCKAERSADGEYYSVSGEKKWITNGIWCDYFTTAVRTGKPGMNGLSVLVIERTKGVTTRKMACQGVLTSGTTFIAFDDVKVPKTNLIGKENGGFRVIMANFNHERVGIIIQCIRFARVCYEEAMKYAHKRKTFGKKLIDHPVIRMKFAHMARQIEATWAWLEALFYQVSKMDQEEAMLKLGGAIAGLKAQSTTTFEFCAREASQIYGGLSYTRGGQAGKVERLYRDVRAYAIPGGSEEIMLDLSIRQALKVHEFMGMKL